MINFDKIGSNAGYRFILAPNRSIGWRQLVLFYIFTCCLALSVSLFFILQGIWMILPFSGLEMLVLGLALHIVFRRTHNREVITINNASVRIEKGLHSPDCCWEFEKSCIRLHDEISGDLNSRRKLELGSHGKYVEVGEFLSNFEKDELVFRLKDCIIPA